MTPLRAAGRPSPTIAISTARFTGAGSRPWRSLASVSSTFSPIPGSSSTSLVNISSRVILVMWLARQDISNYKFREACSFDIDIAGIRLIALNITLSMIAEGGEYRIDLFLFFVDLTLAQAGPITCGKPILRATCPSLCHVHFQKAQMHITRALEKAGLNISSSSKLAPKFHVIVTEYVREIQRKRRAAWEQAELRQTSSYNSPCHESNKEISPHGTPVPGTSSK
ncbi:hypothetical protein RJ639_035413 [Escallonia herrerae]|uniref:Uncharacterized protein n=1 Tax=Escallonia herrerae TaxID=1293975 RepID=A0AA89BDF2_9ASTE|nr:hypothetical protein RJ639_035413 [Escallonia herrerae]